MRIVPNFSKAIEWTGNLMRDYSYAVQGTRWQSTDVSTKPEMRMREILNHTFQVNLDGREHVGELAQDIAPNLPWAEAHFLERVGGEPLNPGEQWRNWPWALAADKHRTEAGGQFSHTYMERYWPKEAGYSDENRADAAKLKPEWPEPLVQLSGIRYKYGDLDDVVNHLLGDPLSRQAYLPVWFPEDTGVVHGERVPCSLGYHWIFRNGYLHTTYYIRSCDFVRHFRDDLYLSVRLSIWLLDQLRQKEDAAWRIGESISVWRGAKLGFFTFHCVSMHCFVNDWNKLWGKAPSGSRGAGAMGIDKIRDAQ